MTGSAADSRMNHPRVTGDAGAVNSLTIDRIARRRRADEIDARGFARRVGRRQDLATFSTKRNIFHICGATIKLETRAWFDPGASRLAERICGRAGVGPESCRVRHKASDRCEMRQMQQVKPKVEPSSHVRSRFDNNIRPV